MPSFVRVYYINYYDAWGMRKKLDEVLQESAENGWLISKLDLSKVDDNIVTMFHSSDALETTTKKIELNTKTIQLPKLMGEPLLRLTPIMLQQGVSQEPI
jgi:hypothetical protein